MAIARQHHSVGAVEVPTESWKTAAILYWLRAIYGIFSLPFVFFKLPLLGTALTRTQGVGYDQFGATRYRVRDPYRDTLNSTVTGEDEDEGGGVRTEDASMHSAGAGSAAQPSKKAKAFGKGFFISTGMVSVS